MLKNEDYKNALDLFESAIGHMQTDDYKMDYLSRIHTVVNPHNDLILLLSQQAERAKDAFEVVERAKGRVFLELMGETLGSVPLYSNPEVFSKLVCTDYLLRRSRAELRQRATKQETTRIEQKCRYFQKELDAILVEIENVAPVYVNLRRGVPAEYATIRQLLL